MVSWIWISWEKLHSSMHSLAKIALHFFYVTWKTCKMQVFQSHPSSTSRRSTKLCFCNAMQISYIILILLALKKQHLVLLSITILLFVMYLYMIYVYICCRIQLEQIIILLLLCHIFVLFSKLTIQISLLVVQSFSL